MVSRGASMMERRSIGGPCRRSASSSPRRVRASASKWRARPPAPLALRKPSRDTPDDDTTHRQQQNQGKQRHRNGQHRLQLIERVERDHDGLPVRDCEHDEQDRARDQDQRRDELLDHATSLLVTTARTRTHLRNGSLEVGSSWPRASTQKADNYPCCGGVSAGRFRRSRISLPVLKNGTDFFSTETWAPVRGLRPMRAGRFFTEKAPKPRSSTRSPRAIAATIPPSIALTMFSTSR